VSGVSSTPADTAVVRAQLYTPGLAGSWLSVERHESGSLDFEAGALTGHPKTPLTLLIIVAHFLLFNFCAHDCISFDLRIFYADT